MKLRMVLAIALGLVFAGGALAEDKGLDNHAKRDPYYEKLKGKKVLFVPLAMGFDLTEGWAAIMRRQAKDHIGYTFEEFRDPNWSTDAGTRAITDAIAQKRRPPYCPQSGPPVLRGKLGQRAVQAGIKVLQVNLETVNPTDTYIGADWVKVGLIEAQALVDHCGKEFLGKSGKVAILEGQPTAASNLYELYAYNHVFADHPENPGRSRSGRHL